MVGATGFEPATSCSQGRRANRTALRPDPFAVTRCRPPGACRIYGQSRAASSPLPGDHLAIYPLDLLRSASRARSAARPSRARAAPSPRAARRSPSIRRRQAARASASPAGKRSPFTPSSTISGMPPIREATTAFDEANASITAYGRFSYQREGRTTNCDSARILSSSVAAPVSRELHAVRAELPRRAS